MTRCACEIKDTVAYLYPHLWNGHVVIQWMIFFFKSGLLHLLNPMALTLFKIGLKMNSNYTPLMFLVLLIHEAFFFYYPVQRSEFNLFTE